MFITVEGCEGAGKSVFAKNLSLNLKKLTDKQIVCTKEPGGTDISDEIRDVFLKKREQVIYPMTELFLIIAARYQHLNELIIPNLNKKNWIICDRYIDSTIVYQGILRNIDIDFMENIFKTSQTYILPDITFLLDCEIDIMIDRINKRIKKSKFDQMNIKDYKIIKDGFINVYKKNKNRIYILNSADKLKSNIKKALDIINSMGSFNLSL